MNILHFFHIMLLNKSKRLYVFIRHAKQKVIYTLKCLCIMVAFIAPFIFCRFNQKHALPQLIIIFIFYNLTIMKMTQHSYITI